MPLGKDYGALQKMFILKSQKSRKKQACLFSWTYTHDAVTGVIEEQRFSPEGAFFASTTYRYDVSGNLKVGNWIKQSATEALPNPEGLARIPTKVTYRKITYHE